MISTDISVWVAALMTIAVISYIFKYNPLFRIAEASGIAVTMGWITIGAIKNVRDIGIIPITKGEISPIIPIILGLLLFTKFSRRYAFASRYGTSIIAGIGIGLSIRGAMETQIIEQIKITSLTFVNVPLMTALNNFIFLIVLITSFMYFYFTAEDNVVIKQISKVGRYALMITFGTMYGSTVMGRLSLLIARFQFLWLKWLGL